MQCKSSCDVSNVDFLFSLCTLLTNIIDIDELKPAQEKAEGGRGIRL